MKAACVRFGISDPRYLLNLDESGASFKPSSRVTRRRAIGLRKEKCLTTQVSTRNINHVTIMGVVAASGQRFKPAVVYPGKQAHARRVAGMTETVHKYLLPCHFFQRDPAGVDSVRFLNWAKEFVAELSVYRSEGQKVLLEYDGYHCHMQYCVLKLFRKNDVEVIFLSAHTSSEMQPLDKSVFGPFKASIQRLLTTASRVKKTLDAFDIARVICLAYDQLFSILNIQSGFQKTGLWDWKIGEPSIEPLRALPFFRESSNAPLPTVEQVVDRFVGRARTLLRDVQVEVGTTVRLHTASGACLTADMVEDAFEEFLQKQIKEHENELRRAAEKEAERQRKIEYPETRAKIARMKYLEPERKRRREDMRNSRSVRRKLAAERARRA